MEEKEQEILSQREKRFKGFPQPFVVSYVKEIALTWVLKAHRGLRCTGEDCLLEKDRIQDWSGQLERLEGDIGTISESRGGSMGYIRGLGKA